MANKEQGIKDDQQIIDPSEEYRTRFMYCSIGATLMCLGVIVLVSGLVVYILSSTGPHTYVNNMFFHNPHEYNNSYWPIIVAIILSSSGIAFITIAIVFTLFACFSHGRIEDHFRNQHQISSQPVHQNNHSQHFTNTRNDRSPDKAITTRTPVKATHDPYEEERLISSPTPILVHPSSSTTSHYPNHQQSQIHRPAANINRQESNESKAPLLRRERNETHHQIQPSHYNHPQQQQQSQSHTTPVLTEYVHHPIQANQQQQHLQQQPPLQMQYVPVVPSKTVEKQSATLTEIPATNSLSSSSSSSTSIQPSTSNQRGDINTVGLPLVNNVSKSSNHHPKKVPPNGFSYLTHPEEIHIFHEYHHQRTSSSGGNLNNHHQQSHHRNYPQPPTARSTVRTTNTASTSHESVL
ncbi:hypothetical protein DERF_002951 [Dermatophagoides farinae]|uniref:Uncharacterized protein n=1 Tax=Dermatophagoides farinae TaxID=6954 RepID=A0A922IBL7_DERFA|nr:basic-leucine zipper transcription factor A-like [Dermatophagoides farinae]KAH7641949.1 hypothetical protein HUG17_4994 [Dermatophagoides farinae]KAH9529042.1 hypothetical protein DERF_002951 [Dermatophagoides farinae]